MAVRKLGKYYQIDYYVGRKRIREILKGVTTRREAEEIERERLRSSTGPIEFNRFEDLARWFLAHPDKQSKKTLARDCQRFEKYLLPYFGHSKPHDINSSMVDDYKVRRQRQFAANATINRELALLKSIFDGFVKSPTSVRHAHGHEQSRMAALRCILRHCSVL